MKNNRKSSEKLQNEPIEESVSHHFSHEEQKHLASFNSSSERKHHRKMMTFIQMINSRILSIRRFVLQSSDLFDPQPFHKVRERGAKHSPSDVTSGALCDRASEASSTIKLMMQIQRYTPKHIIAIDKHLSLSLTKFAILKSDQSTHDVTAACRHF